MKMTRDEYAKVAKSFNFFDRKNESIDSLFNTQKEQYSSIINKVKESIGD